MFDTNERRKTLHNVLSWITAILVIGLGVGFIVACVLIYNSGTNPFTRESVGRMLLYLLAPSIITVLVVAVGGALRLVYPVEDKAKKSKPDVELTLKRLQSTRDLSLVDEEVRASVLRARLLRKIAGYVNLFLALVGAVIATVYCLIPENITDELNATVISCTLAALICMLPSLIFYIVRIFTDKRSMNTEIALLTSLERAKMGGDTAKSEVFDFIAKYKREFLLGIRIAVFIAGTVYIVLGVINGGMKDVLDKAIKICTECIGLG